MQFISNSCVDDCKKKEMKIKKQLFMFLLWIYFSQEFKNAYSLENENYQKFQDSKIECPSLPKIIFISSENFALYLDSLDNESPLLFLSLKVFPTSAL